MLNLSNCSCACSSPFTTFSFWQFSSIFLPNLTDSNSKSMSVFMSNGFSPAVYGVLLFTTVYQLYSTKVHMRRHQDAKHFRARKLERHALTDYSAHYCACVT